MTARLQVFASKNDLLKGASRKRFCLPWAGHSMRALPFVAVRLRHLVGIPLPISRSIRYYGHVFYPRNRPHPSMSRAARGGTTVLTRHPKAHEPAVELSVEGVLQLGQADSLIMFELIRIHFPRACATPYSHSEASSWQVRPYTRRRRGGCGVLHRRKPFLEARTKSRSQACCRLLSHASERSVAVLLRLLCVQDFALEVCVAIGGPAAPVRCLFCCPFSATRRTSGRLGTQCLIAACRHAAVFPSRTSK